MNEPRACLLKLHMQWWKFRWNKLRIPCRLKLSDFLLMNEWKNIKKSAVKWVLKSYGKYESGLGEKSFLSKITTTFEPQRFPDSHFSMLGSVSTLWEPHMYSKGMSKNLVPHSIKLGMKSSWKCWDRYQIDVWANSNCKQIRVANYKTKYFSVTKYVPNEFKHLLSNFLWCASEFRNFILR